MDVDNTVQEQYQHNGTSDLFELCHWPTETIQSDILAINATRKFLYVLTQKNEMYRIDYERIGSEANSYPLPPDKDKAQVNNKIKEKMTKLFCDCEGNHCFIKHNGKMYYFNGNHSKIKELSALKDIDVCAMAFDEKIIDQKSTGEMLISDYSSSIYLYKLDAASETKYRESCTLLTQIPLNNRDRIYGLHVRYLYMYIIYIVRFQKRNASFT